MLNQILTRGRVFELVFSAMYDWYFYLQMSTWLILVFLYYYYCYYIVRVDKMHYKCFLRRYCLRENIFYFYFVSVFILVICHETIGAYSIN